MHLEPQTGAILLAAVAPTQSSNSQVIPKPDTSDDTHGGKPDDDDVVKSISHHTMVYSKCMIAQFPY